MIKSPFKITAEDSETGEYPRFLIGEYVSKKKGSNWHGFIVGYYSTDLNPRGYCIESAFEAGSVQIYPEDALAMWDGKTV